jgi:hypothetical protein
MTIENFNKKTRDCQGSVVSRLKGTYAVHTHHMVSLAVKSAGAGTKDSPNLPPPVSALKDNSSISLFSTRTKYGQKVQLWDEGN